MSKRLMMVSCFVVLAAVLAGAAAASAGRNVTAAPVSVAVVDYEKLITEHPRTKEAREAAKREAVAKTEALRNKEALRKSLIESRDMLRPGSKAYLDFQKKIQIHEKTVELDLDMIQVEYQFTVVSALREVQEMVEKEIREVALEKGIQIVLNRSSRPVGGRTSFEFLDRLAMRDTAYAHDALDITKEVMARLLEKTTSGR